MDSNYVLGRGLEPHFKVLFSAIFQGVSLGNFHQGRNLWKVAEAKVWSILVNPRTFFMCVLIIFYLPSAGCENPFLIRGTVICGGNSARPALGSINTGTPLTDRLIPDTVGIDLLIGRLLLALQGSIMDVPC